MIIAETEHTDISTHAPHARRGGRAMGASPGNTRFLLTRLMRGAANAANQAKKGADDFYSRASCEARRLRACSDRPSCGFLLTRLMRGAAVSQDTSPTEDMPISTHAPHARRGIVSEL